MATPPLSAAVHVWKLPRAPLFRLCVLNFRVLSYPDEGAGVWEVEGYEDLDTPDEKYVLRRVMPARKAGPTGELIRVRRQQHDEGHVRIWAAQLEDPLLNQPARVGMP